MTFLMSLTFYKIGKGTNIIPANSHENEEGWNIVDEDNTAILDGDYIFDSNRQVVDDDFVGILEEDVYCMSYNLPDYDFDNPFCEFVFLDLRDGGFEDIVKNLDIFEDTIIVIDIVTDSNSYNSDGSYNGDGGSWIEYNRKATKEDLGEL